MSLMDGIADGFRWLAGRETDLQTRSDSDGNPASIEDLILRLRTTRTSPWRAATTREAMGVPAVFKAISLIANTTGTLSMEAFRKGDRLPIEDTPRLIIRPNPFTTPYTFWRDSAYYKARYGETWWWTARRDIDGSAMSLIPIDPRQIVASENPDDYLRPFIDWTMPSGRTVRMPNDDMTWLPYLPDPDNRLRGFGPLQACGAAISVAVEAQEFAANFFAGSPSDLWIKSAVDLTDGEAAKVKEQWVSGAAGLPKVTDPTIEDVKDIAPDPAKAQLSESRLHQNGEVALMFSMPPTLLNYAIQGSTLLYQNIGQVWDDLLRQCLLPHYLEPMEQAMSDLLTRSTVGRFSTAGLLRADPKTRAEVYNLLIPLGVETPEEARAAEGFDSGDIENRPVPFAPPQAVPSSLPIQTRSIDGSVRCDGTRVLRGQVVACGKLLAENGPFVGSCPRCKKVHAVVNEVSVRSLQDAADERTDRLIASITAIAERPINVTTPVTFAEGAIRVDVAAPTAAPEPNVIELEYNDRHQLVRARNA